MSVENDRATEDLRNVHRLLKAFPSATMVASRQHGFLNEAQMKSLMWTYEFFADVCEHIGDVTMSKEQ